MVAIASGRFDQVHSEHTRFAVGTILRHTQEQMATPTAAMPNRSEEHTSELQSLMRISYAVFCLKKKHTPTARHLQTKEHTYKAPKQKVDRRLQIHNTQN